LDFQVRASSCRLLRHGEFENWAVIALGGIPNKVQVGDMGVDGRIAGTQRAEHPDHASDLNFKKAKAEANAAQKDLI
jgi:hypothetical protein